MKTFFCVTSKKGLHVFSCKPWAPVFEVKQRWVPLPPGFSANQNFWVCACTLCTPTSNNTAFHNSIIGNFMFYQDQLETYLLQLFGHPENSEWFSILYVAIFEVNIVDEQKQTWLVTIFLFFKVSIALNCFTAPPALSLLRHPWICMLCQQTSSKRWLQTWIWRHIVTLQTAYIQ